MQTTFPYRHFSTSDLPNYEKFDSYRKHMSRLFTVDRSSKPIDDVDDADGDAYLCGDLWLFHTRFPARRCVRTTERIRRDDVDFLTIAGYARGGYGGVEGDDHAVMSDRVQVLDYSQPFSYETTRTEIYGVGMKREPLEKRIGDLRSLHSLMLNPALAQFLSNYLRLLSEHLPMLPSEAARELEAATYDVVATCLRPSRDFVERARPAFEATQSLRVKRYIRRNLEMPGLGPEKICRDIGVSRRSLYRFFETSGGVQHFIQNARLERIYDILRLDQAPETIVDIAARFQFESKEVFWRAFKRRFGVTPGDARHGSVGPGVAAANARESDADSMQEWIDHLCR